MLLVFLPSFAKKIKPHQLNNLSIKATAVQLCKRLRVSIFLSVCVCVCILCRWVMMPLVMKKMYWCSHTPEPVGFTSIYFRSNGRIMKYLWEIGGQAIAGACLYPHPKNKNCAISRNIFQPRRREHDNLWTADVWIELVFVTLKEKDRHIRLECNSFI